MPNLYVVRDESTASLRASNLQKVADRIDEMAKERTESSVSQTSYSANSDSVESLYETIDELRQELFAANQKIQLLTMGNASLMDSLGKAMLQIRKLGNVDGLDDSDSRLF